MSRDKSEQMMALLQELSTLKQIDKTAARRTRRQNAEYQERQQKRSEIRKAIKRLAAQNE